MHNLYLLCIYILSNLCYYAGKFKNEGSVVQEINLYELLRYYARNWLILLSALMVGAIIGLVYTAFIQTPLYKSDATMFVVGARSSSTDTTINNNYTELFKSRRVLEPVIQGSGYNGGYELLKNRTTATNDKNTDVLKVSIADKDPKESKTLLQQSLQAFRKEARELYESDNIRIIDDASTPVKPYNVKVGLQLGVSMAATLLLVMVAMFFVYDYHLNTPAAPTKKKPTKKLASTKRKTAKKNARLAAIKAVAMHIIARIKLALKHVMSLLAGDGGDDAGAAPVAAKKSKSTAK